MLPILCVAVVVAVWILWGLQSYKKNTAAAPSPALPEITSATQPMTVDEIHLRLQRTLNASTPGHFVLEVDKDACTITIDQWSDGMNASVPNAALHYKEYLLKWRAQLENMRQLGDQIQQLVSDHGHPELSVVYRLVNDDDHGQIFAVIERGEVVYDVVEDTPPGEEVPDPTSRVQPSASSSAYGDYVINTSSGVFHDAACPYAEQVAAYNRADYHGDRLDLLARGLRPCQRCCP